MLVPIDRETGRKKKNLTDAEKKDRSDRLNREEAAKKARKGK